MSQPLLRLLNIAGALRCAGVPAADRYALQIEEAVRQLQAPSAPEHSSRDLFAAAALVGFLANPQCGDQVAPIARNSWRMAEAMLLGSEVLYTIPRPPGGEEKA